MKDWWMRWRPWLMLLMAAIYDVSPVDAVPDAPIIGWADDLGVTGLAVLLAFTWWRQRRAAAEPALEVADAV